jgi:hypothetical protein
MKAEAANRSEEPQPSFEYHQYLTHDQLGLGAMSKEQL